MLASFPQTHLLACTIKNRKFVMSGVKYNLPDITQLFFSYPVKIPFVADNSRIRPGFEIQERVFILNIKSILRVG